MMARLAGIAWLALAVLGGQAYAADRLPSPRLDITVIDQNLSVSARNVSLHDTLKQIARRMALRLTIEGWQGDQPISIAFRALPLHEALEQLLLGKDYALRVLTTTPGHRDQPGSRALHILIVFSRPPIPQEEHPTASAQPSAPPEYSGKIPSTPSANLPPQTARTLDNQVDRQTAEPPESITTTSKTIIDSQMENGRPVEERLQDLGLLAAEEDPGLSQTLTEALDDPDPEIRAIAKELQATITP